MGPTHNGMSYHAPGPDGQPWLHLRGPAGQPAPNWALAEGQTPSNEGTPAPSVHGGDTGNANGLDGGMWDHQFMPFNGGHGHGHLPPPGQGQGVLML